MIAQNGFFKSQNIKGKPIPEIRVAKFRSPVSDEKPSWNLVCL